MKKLLIKITIMKKSATIVFMMLLVTFVIMYLAIDFSNPAVENTPSESISKKEEANLSKYQERFERNTYHLNKALTSIDELKSMLYTLDNEMIGDAAINLEILHHRSLIHLEEVMKSLKKYEEYPNLREHDLLEEAIKRLEKIDHEIIGDSLQQKDIYQAFNYTINALAKAELNISESAIKSNQPALAKLALKQAQIHVKNAFLLDYSLEFDDGKHFDMELNVFKELDSLIENESISIRDLDHQLTKISAELDVLLQMSVKE